MDRTPLAIIASIFLLLGLLGFLSNPLIGSDALFMTDPPHNLLHVILGGTLLAVALWSRRYTEIWLKLLGAFLSIFGLFGALTTAPAGGALFGLFMTNEYSNWFHLIAGIIIFISALWKDGDLPRVA